jgi:hypothetical protein
MGSRVQDEERTGEVVDEVVEVREVPEAAGAEYRSRS